MIRIVLIRILWKGSSSTVMLGKVFFDGNNGASSTTVAIKAVDMESSSFLERERITLKQLEGCPEIIRSFGTSRLFDSPDDTQPVYAMYLEYVPGGSISSLLRSAGPLKEGRARGYTRSILKGLAHVHRKGFVHCDLKPDNILVSGESDVKIADFGLAKRKWARKEGFGPHGIRCTPLFIAPECVARDEYEPPMDIWALGCIVVEMVTGRQAVRCEKGVDVRALLAAIGDGSLRPEIPEEKLSEEGKDFLRKCFARDPASRWTAEKLLQHPFVLEEDYGDYPHMDMINKLLADDDDDDVSNLISL